MIACGTDSGKLFLHILISLVLNILKVSLSVAYSSLESVHICYSVDLDSLNVCQAL